MAWSNTNSSFSTTTSLKDNPFAWVPTKQRKPVTLGNQETWSFIGCEDNESPSTPAQTISISASGFFASKANTQGFFASKANTQGFYNPFGDVTPKLNNATSSTIRETNTISLLVVPKTVKELTYQQLLAEPYLDGHSGKTVLDAFKTPDMLLPNSVEEVRLYLPADFDIIPFAWIHLLQASKTASCPALRSVQICFQSLARPFITDINDRLENRENFISMLSQFKASGISVDILFRTVSAEYTGCYSDEIQNFRKVDLNTLSNAIRDLAHQEHTDAVTNVLGDESRLKDRPIRPTEEGCRFRMHMHKARTEIDEWL
jgi:hypothetical protein